jgi:hypothetical protein
MSLWDMEEFAAHGLHAAILLLMEIACYWRTARPAGDAVAAMLLGQKRTLTIREREDLEVQLRNVESHLRHSGLPTSGEAVMEFRTELLNWRTEGFTDRTADDVVSRIDDIHRTVRREMKTLVFLYVAAPDSERFRSPLAGWETTVKRWPRTETDIIESSKCFALGRFAASAFHILLVAELGAIQVCDLLNVSGDKPGWGCVQRLDHILARPFEKRTPLEQKHSALLKDVAPLLNTVKDSFRHKITHVDNKLNWIDTGFGPDVAAEIIAATRGFMRRLASELPHAG